MKEIINRYKKWKNEHDKDYCYDEIHDFVSQTKRGDLQKIMDFFEEKFTSDNSKRR